MGARGSSLKVVRAGAFPRAPVAEHEASVVS